MIERLFATRHAAPDWTDGNDHDPGVTLLQLPNFVADGLLFLYRGDASHGRVNGLAVQTVEPGHAAQVHVSPGHALASDGQTVGLAAVASRYIGETEKSLALRFSDVAAGGATLQYDDAEALFDDEP